MSGANPCQSGHPQPGPQNVAAPIDPGREAAFLSSAYTLTTLGRITPMFILSAIAIAASLVLAVVSMGGWFGD